MKDAGSILAASSAGLLKSRDNGANWTVLALGGIAVTHVHVHPADSLRVYAGSNAGLFRSSDGGTSWSPVGGLAAGAFISGILGSTSDRNQIVISYIGLNDSGGWTDKGGVLRSADGGITWSRAFEGGRAQRLSRCGDDGSEYWLATTAGLVRSMDSGATWSTATSSANYTDVVGSAGCGTIYASIYPTGVVRSNDHGATWSGPLTAGLALEDGRKSPSSLAIDPDDAAHVLAATHGGLYASNTSGDLWTAVAGIRNVAVRGITADSTNLIVASYGSGLWRRPIAGGEWKRSALQRDFVGGAYASPLTPGLVLAPTYFPGALWRSLDGGTSFEKSTSTDNVFAIAFHPTSANIVLAATQTSGIQKSVDGGQTWTSLNSGLTPWPTPAGTFIDTRALAFHPADPNRIVIGTHGRGFFVTANAGSSWTPVGGAFGAAFVNSLVVAPKTGALYAQISDSGVARSTDFGATWNLVTAGLPSPDVSLVVDAETGDVFATSAKGLFSLAPTATEWLERRECDGGGALGRALLLNGPMGRRIIAASEGGLVSRPL